MRLSTKIAVSTSVVVALTATVATWIALSGQAEQQRREFRQTNTEALELLALAVAPAVAEGRHERAQAALDAIANYPERFPDVRGLTVLDREGRVIADLDPKRFNTVMSGPAIAAELELTAPSAHQLGADELRIAVPLRLTHPLGILRATLSEKRLAKAIDAQQRNATFLVFAMMIAVGIALQATHRRLVGRRVVNLAQAAAKLRRGKMDVRADVEGRDEIAQLGSAFNGMADELKIYTDDLERLVDERTAELEAANVRLELLATTDQLTKIHNRRYFEEEASRALEAAWRAERPFSVVVIDVDHFKSFNDRFGHAIGDVVLRDVAKIIKDNARAADFVARIGGEEFAVAMPDATAELAAQAADRMRERLETAKHPEAPEIGDEKVTASFGVASHPEYGDRLDELLNVADGALYQSKEDGRNRVTIAQSRRSAPPRPRASQPPPSVPPAPRLPSIEPEEPSTGASRPDKDQES